MAKNPLDILCLHYRLQHTIKVLDIFFLLLSLEYVGAVQPLPSTALIQETNKKTASYCSFFLTQC